MKLLALIIATLISLTSCMGQQQEVTFKVDLSNTSSVGAMAIRGNLDPLSWEKGLPMTDEDKDGVYEAKVIFNTKKRNLRFKFTNEGKYELEGSDNRIAWFKGGPQSFSYTFNEFNFYDSTTIAKLTYTPEEIKEDVAILRKTMLYTHPNLFRFQGSLSFEESLKTLEAELLADPGIINVYKSVSKFAAPIKCSHTFTNPWNQGPDVKRAIFHQPDKVPFTFLRIGSRIFMDRNASANNQLEKGLEITHINKIPSSQIMERLAQYITSDGTNYEKRLQRLTLSGQNKFELFDIFFPLEFGSVDSFQLQLKNLKTEETITATVEAISKTKRTAILSERYPDMNNSFADGWNFKTLDEQTAILKMHSFATFNTDFEWKKFLKNVFNELKTNNISNLIIDIRGNEGGDNEVVEYILKQIIKEKITIKNIPTTSAYRKIPEDIKPHINTWDKRPFDWGKLAKKQANGKYIIKQPLAGKTKTYKPNKNGFRGNTFLLTDAENSSATHIMATYVKRYKLATIVGQETGGSQMGVNGGYMFFHRLPNSRVEIDIPILGINLFPTNASTPTGGIQPDVKVEKNAMDFINGVDTELEKVLQLIK